MSCFKLPDSLCDKIESKIKKFWWSNNSKDRGIYWTSGAQLQKSKEEGGLGFRNFRHFNQAMLAKQAWRVQDNSESLLIRVLKHKYFKHTSFWEAKLGSSPSYAWRSLLHGRDLLRAGMRWQLGKGNRIRASAPWLPRLPSFRPVIINHQLDHITVDTFIDRDNTCWKVEELKNYLVDFDIQEICQIPIISDPPEDRLRWHFADNGVYTVKSGYALAVAKEREAENTGESSMSNINAFKKLWKLKIEKKIVHLIWRMIMGVLPTGSNLRRRGIDADSRCAFCRQEIETEKHLFFDCKQIRGLWDGSSLLSPPPPPLKGSHATVGELLLHQIQTRKEEDLVDLFVTIWGIWYFRNQKLFQKAVLDLSMVADLIHRKIDEQKWRKAGTHNLTEMLRPPKNRSGEENGIFVHFDAGWLPETHQTMAGVVIRTGGGQLLAAATLKLPPAENPHHAEAMACLEGVRLVSSLPVSRSEKVTLLGDAQTLIEEIQEDREGKRKRDEGGSKEIVNEILRESKDKESWSFGVCGRRSNYVADYLATNVARGDKDGTWSQECIPVVIHRLAGKDVSFSGF